MTRKSKFSARSHIAQHRRAYSGLSIALIGYWLLQVIFEVGISDLATATQHAFASMFSHGVSAP